ncbi:MAG: AAA family ATPase [Spirochaetota bacterium]
MYTRLQYKAVSERLSEPRRYIQILFGPRQTGKTTLVQQVLERIAMPSLYVSADSAGAESNAWIDQQWETARIRLRTEGRGKGFILVIDEVQKVHDWSTAIKRQWDRDTKDDLGIRVLLLGSSPLLIQHGLRETLAGRFEMMRLTHWSYPEMKKAFGCTVEQFMYFGGYPGAAAFMGDEDRFRHYVKDSLIETSITRDVLMMTRIDKPALLKRLFELGCLYSGQIMSYTKMLGQLADAGNTTTLSHYLDLLAGAGMISGMQKFSMKAVYARSSSPKFMVLNTALMTVQMGSSFKEAQADPDRWGRICESAVGAHLLNASADGTIRVCYWREGDHEVDFVLSKGKSIIAIEVKSGRSRGIPIGIGPFRKRYASAKVLQIGTGGISFDEFLSLPLPALFE